MNPFNNTEIKIDVFSEVGEENIFENCPVRAKFCRITPELAAKWLERSKERFVNRPLSVKTVNRYMQDMLDNKWIINGETIIFDNDGKLLNGQTRLNAVVNANVPIIALVVCGIDEKAFLSMDSGKTRSSSDIFSILGVDNAREMAQAVTKYLSLKRGKSIAGRNSDQNLKYSGGPIGNQNIALKELYEQNPTMFRTALDIAKGLDRKRHAIRTETHLSIPQIAAYTMYLMVDKSNTEQSVMEFWEDFFGCYPSTRIPNKAVVAVVDKIRRANQHKATELNARQLQNHVIAAWNMRKAGRQPKTIKITAEEKLRFN